MPSSLSRISVPSTVGLTPVVTLVLWSLCLLGGVLGAIQSHPHRRPAPPQPPTQVEKITVQLAQDTPQPDATPPPPTTTPAPIDPPPPAPPVAVAAPSPALAFILPVTGPVRLVAANQAASSSRPAPAAAAPAPINKLVFGRGEGRQPAPTYPAESIRRGQEGTVTIRFTVDPDGRVISTEVAEPSPWLLLDESAAYTVRHYWRFPSGAQRTYEVAIHFALQK